MANEHANLVRKTDSLVIIIKKRAVANALLFNIYEKNNEICKDRPKNEGEPAFF